VIEALGDSLPFAVAAAISPLPIVALVILLTTPSPAGKVAAFFAGWLAGLAGTGAIVILLADGTGPAGSDEPSDVVAVVMLVAAAGLFWLGARSWGKRPVGDDDPEPPDWSRAVSGFGPAKAAGVGLVAAGNPKNLLLTVGGALEIAAAGSGASMEFAALAVFVAVSSLGVLTPVTIRLVRGEASAANLARLRVWLERHSAAIMAAILLVIAANLAGDAISALAG
jgi:hypothetical protein